MSPRHPRGTIMRVRRDPDPARKKPWGVWWNVYQTGFTGRPKQKSEWFATEEEAQEFKQRTLEALEQATPIGADDVPIHWRADSLKALAVNWLAHVQDQREAATHASYTDLVDHYLAPAPGHPRAPGLGPLIVSETTLTPKVIADFLTGLHRDGVSLSMRRRVHRALSALCTYARFEGRLTGGNPCHDLGRLIRRKGEEEHQAEPNPFTGAEVVRIFDELAAVDEDWLPYYQFLLDVGVRVGEAAALKWTDVDLDHARATIAASYSTIAKADKLPKTHERREVHLTAKVVEQLLQWRPVQRQEAFRRGRPQPVHVFTSRRLARYLPNGSLRRVFARVMAACAITGHTPHDFRDTFATSHLVTNWGKLAWVSKQLGHKSVSTTETYYFAYRDSAVSRGYADDIRRWERGE